MQLIVMAIGAAMVIGGVVVIARALRDPVHRDFADARFRCAWASAVAWFGALPLISAICDAAALSPRVRDIGYTLVLVVGLATTIWFALTGLLSRRAEFQALQRNAIEAGERAPRYFWRPWPMFGWTLGIGFALIFGASIGLGALIGAAGPQLTVEEVNQLSQTIANIIVTSLYVLLVIAATAGLWRWQQLRREALEIAEDPTPAPENTAKAAAATD